MRNSRKHMCGVPYKECCGGAALGTNSMGSIKVHRTSVEAFNCYRKWLLKQGYKQVGSREFQKDENSPVTVLTKKARFGAPLRKGKSGDKGTSDKRLVPCWKNGGYKGTILSL